MKKAQNDHQVAKKCKKCCFTILNSLFLMAWLLFSSHTALAAQICKTTSITASTPTADFVVNGNGTVTHTKTGLMWKVCSEGQQWSSTSGVAACAGYQTNTWQATLQGVATLNQGSGFAGFTDWRVPNIKELTSIAEVQCVYPAINATIFPSTPTFKSWSSSIDAGLASDVMVLPFDTGRANLSAKSSIGHVRLVRAGL